MFDKSGFEKQFSGENCIFRLLTDEEKEILMNNHVITRYKRNEYLFKEGDIPTGMKYLKSGKVKMTKLGIGGRDQIIRMFTDNGLISYRSLIAKEPHNGSAIALEDSVIIMIPEKILYDVLLHNYDFSLALLRDLARELGNSNLRTVSLTQKHVRGRLAESLLFLVEKYGFEKETSTLKIYLSREEIASLSNMTPSNAIRTLSAFATEKLISMDGKKINIINLPALEKISKQG